MSRIEDIRERLDAATPGPWPEDYVYSAVRHIARNCDYIESYTDPDFGWNRYNDAPLIIHAPADLRDLLTVAEAARKAPLQHDARCQAWGSLDGCDCPVEDLRAALARLDGEPTDA